MEEEEDTWPGWWSSWSESPVSVSHHHCHQWSWLSLMTEADVVDDVSWQRMPGLLIVVVDWLRDHDQDEGSDTDQAAVLPDEPEPLFALLQPRPGQT